MPDEVRARLAALSLPAVAALADALRDEDPRVRVAAAVQVMDRLYGRPYQQSDVTVSRFDPGQAHLQALRELVYRDAQPRSDNTTAPAQNSGETAGDDLH